MIERELFKTANAKATFIIETQLGWETEKHGRTIKSDKIIYVFIQRGGGDDHTAKRTVKYWQDFVDAFKLMQLIDEGAMGEMKEKDGEYIAAIKHTEYKKTDIANRTFGVEVIRTDKGKHLRFSAGEEKEGDKSNRLYFDLPLRKAEAMAHTVYNKLRAYSDAYCIAEVLVDEILPYFGKKKKDIESKKESENKPNSRGNEDTDDE